MAVSLCALKIGAYSFPVGQCGCKPKWVSVKNRRGDVYKRVKAVDVEGTIFGTDAQDLKANLADMLEACEKGNQDVCLYDFNGLKTGINIVAADAIGGIVTIDELRFTQDTGAEWVTQATFAFTVYAEVAADGLRPGTLIELFETITRNGDGGQRNALQECIEGPPISVTLVQQTACYTTQSGFAVAYGDYPKIPKPIWAAFLQKDETVIVESGGRNQGSNEFRIDWAYKFQSAKPLIGLPTVWKG